MPTTPWVPIVRNIVDGTDKVSSEVLNPILKSYTDRTQHLYEKFNDLEDKSVIIAFDQRVTGASVAQYSVVYYDFESVTPGLVLAKPAFATSTYATQFKAANSAFVFGIVKSPVPGSGDKIVDVYLQGLIQVTGIVTALLDSSSDNTGFVGGPLYLSSKEAGKLTSVPGGQAIYAGYAKNLNEIYFNPAYESFNDFFLSFKYALLDRPAGTPSLSGTTWSITGGDLTRVGWIPANFNGTITSRQPDNAKYGVPAFFYNLPDTDATIDADDGLTAAEKADAKALRKSLPPSPINFTFLSVNGVIQEAKEDTSTLGVYVVNEYGIWWYSNQADLQPWAKDLDRSIALTPASINTGTSTITLNDHGWENGDTLTFFIVSGSGASLPTGITEGPSYTVTNATQNTFQLSGVTLSTTGAGTFYITWKPEAWIKFRGTDYLRARMMLQFTKINPDYKSSVVTSLRPDATSGKSVKFINSAGDEAATGDLSLKFDLNRTVIDTTPGPTAIKDVDYNTSTGDLEVKTTPIVSSVVGLGLAKATTNPVTGQVSITVENTNLSNLVTSLEVEQARLEYVGLHSYLTMDYSLLPAGFIGKFLLPAQLPDANLQFKIILIGKSSISELSASTKTKLKFQFSYAITKPNTVLTSTVAELKTFTVDLGTGYIKNTCVVFTPVEFVIPRSALVEGGVVNFRLTRVKPSGGDVTSNFYDGNMSVVGTYWNLG